MNVVGAQHEFHDPAYAADWANRFIPTPEREQLFATMIDRLIQEDLPARHIVELGIGPGYLAERVLRSLPDVTYEGVDFSTAMMGLAQKRLAPWADRVRFTQADLLDESWIERVERPVGAVISTWALHDLGGQAQTAQVYRACARLLPPGGLLLNGDFVKPEGAELPFEPGRFLVDQHLAYLAEAGFQRTACLIFLEREIEQPTSAQNYACLAAWR